MEQWIVYSLMAAAFIVMPGADFSLILKNTLTKGRQIGQVTAFGIAGGLVVHTLAVVFGLSALIAQSTMLFDIVKYIGAAYLFYLGITSFGTKNEASADELAVSSDAASVTDSRWAVFAQAVLANILNPKTVLFYLTFLPQFVVRTKPVLPQLAVLGTILVLLSLVWFTFLAYALESIRTYLDNPLFKKGIQRVTGTLLISFGLKLALEER